MSVIPPFFVQHCDASNVKKVQSRFKKHIATVNERVYVAIQRAATNPPKWG